MANREKEREQMREKASHTENGTTGRKERVREREKKVERNIRAGGGKGERERVASVRRPQQRRTASE